MKTLFQWLDVHPGSYWLMAGLGTLLLVVQVGSAGWKEKQNRADDPRAIWRDGVVLFLFLFAWRWPFLLAANEFNPDEGQLIAGAITLSHDPVFWRSVDGTTSGPLNFYLLVPYAWFGLPLDYFTARLTGLLLVFGALFFMHQALARQFGRTVAWLGVVPALGFFSTITYSDLIHYSSEHLSLFMTAVAIWLLSGRAEGDRCRLRLACFIAGAAVYAKLQVAPLSGALVIWALWQVWGENVLRPSSRWRALGGVVLAALVPTFIAAGLTAMTGQMDAAVRRYIFHNLLYVGEGKSFIEAMREMTILALKDGRLPLLLGTALVMLLASGFYSIVCRRRPLTLFVIGGFLTMAGVIAVVVPRREFLHYTLLVPIPLTLWLGASVGAWWVSLGSGRARLVLATLIFLLTGLIPVITRAFQPRPEIYGQFAYHWSHPRTSAAVFARVLSGQIGSLGVWGWASNLYVESGLSQATRDAHSIWSIQPSAQRDYHRIHYIEDLRLHEPLVFIDAVGPGAFALENRATQAHEIFPELADYIARNYTLVIDLDDARIYARNGLPVLQEMSPSRVSLLRAKGRLSVQELANRTPPPLTPLDHFQRKTIANREVIMLLPPTQVQWALDANVREVSLEFGFDPVAYEQGHSNGAELVLELVDDKKTSTIFRCFLDPARQADDRQPRTVVITLPSFSAGTRLVLRSDPGPYGDTAWDWVYLANLQFKRGMTAASSGTLR